MRRPINDLELHFRQHAKGFVQSSRGHQLEATEFDKRVSKALHLSI